MEQGEIFDLYVDYFLSSFGQVTATGLSAITDGLISHYKITRSLSEPEFGPKDLWKEVKPIVKKVSSEEAVVIFDDSVLEKAYSKENEMICWHYDNSKQREVKGINLLTGLYFSNGISIPVYIAKKVFINEDDSKGIFYLITSDSGLSYEKLFASYQKRWKIEDSHRSIKQNAGITKSQTKVVRIQSNHIFASLCAFVKLEKLRVLNSANQTGVRKWIYINAQKKLWIS